MSSDTYASRPGSRGTDAMEETDTQDARSAVGSDPGSEPGAEAASGDERVGGLWSDAWRDLRRNPLFLVSAVILVVILLMAAFPGLFTSVDPGAGDLGRSLQPPSAQAWFGYDLQGYDVYSRTIHGARYSIIVGVLATLGARRWSA